MDKFNEAIENHREKLELYVPIVERVHGGTHPEFHEVAKLFNDLMDKIKAAGSQELDLDKKFSGLRDVTNNYTVPSDTCESYEAVYQMLADWDGAYQNLK